MPAVLQVEGLAPCFGTLSGLSEQGLAFDFQAAPLASQAVGQVAKLDFDGQGKHYSFKGLIVHIQGGRAVVSLRDAPKDMLGTLYALQRDSTSTMANRLSALQMQQACHAQFMSTMKAVVDDFYLLLPDPLRSGPGLPGEFDRLRPRLTRLLTQAYPMHPEPRGSLPEKPAAGASEPIDMERVDDWIRRTTIAQKVVDAIGPLASEFDRHYSSQLNSSDKPVDHPFQPDAVLSVLADLIEPLKLNADARVLCYETMGQAFARHAGALYQAMLGIIGDMPQASTHHPHQVTSLEEWLRLSAAGGENNEGATAGATSSAQMGELAALLGRLTENLGELSVRLPAAAAQQPGARFIDHTLVPAMLARDRIYGRFLPAHAGVFDTDGLRLEAAGSTGAFGQVLSSLSDLDSAALQGLQALMRQPPPFDPGPEKLAQGSQIRALMLQAHGLLLEYTLNGLTYQAQPNHPAWSLINALDALHLGADDRGQFLDPALHQATSLAMQWLLGQDDVDAALEQVNTLLTKIILQLSADRQARRVQQLEKLGVLVLDPAVISTVWCVVKREEEAVPYEVLGMREGVWALLNRSATALLEMPAERFLAELDSGQIAEADSFDEPFLERIADATLTASLNAVHAFTWQDPASGCLKRSALMDELERRLAHPVTEPPTFCALIEIPAMRPGLSSLPADELTILQKRAGDLLLQTLQQGEHCGRLSDMSFLMVFSPQDPERLADRLSRLKADIESLHPEWKLVGAAVPLLDGEASPLPSGVLRRANLACAPQRQQGGFDLSCLSNVPPVSNQIDPLPFSSLYLRCQKIAACTAGAPSHYEILLGVSEDLVPAHTTQSFVVMAEQTGRIHDLDLWMLRSVLEWMNRNADGLAQLSGLSVNLSGSSLTQTDHVDAMVRLLGEHTHLTRKLIVEVTETAAIDNMDKAVRSLRKLRKLGCRVALDDFGSGYSSYSYVRSLPLDYLKIDGTYIRNILNDKTDQALTASMVDVAHALGLKVIAEYVDSEATCAWLKEIGVDYVQGYWVHKPERLDGLVLH